MTLLVRALVLGHGMAALVAIWVSESGLALWAALLVAWIGGSVLTLAFAAIGVLLWREAPTRRSSFTASEKELRLWDEDLARERLDVQLMRDRATASAPRRAGMRKAG